MKIVRSLISLVLCCLVTASAIYGQEPDIPHHVWKETGLPYIQNFSPKDYNGGTQNFDILQDKRGLIYVANSWGVLIYDGVSWRLISMPNRSSVRSLCIVDERIYTGAVDELGYLEPDAAGRLHYVSLLDKIPEERRDFKDVYDILALDADVYFRTRHSLFRLTGDSIQIWDSDVDLQASSLLNDLLYIAQRGIGLGILASDRFTLLSGGSMFANVDIRSILPFGDSELLIVTFTEGLFLFDGSEFSTFPASIDEFLFHKQVRDGISIPGGLYAFATSRGVVIMDQNGELCQIADKSSGLLDELIISLFIDNQGGLWLALNNGIARVEIPSPVSRFQDASGIESFVGSVTRHNGRLYAATDRGVYYLDDSTFPSTVFRPVEGISTLCWSFLEFDDRLLVGTQDAVFEITGTSAEEVNSLSAIVLYRTRRYPNLVLAGLLEGLAVMYSVDGSWQTHGRVPAIRERIISIEEDDSGAIWLGTQSDGILKIHPPGRTLEREKYRTSGDPNIIFSDTAITRYGGQHGLPAGAATPSRIGTHLVFKTNQGLKRFNAERNLFEPDTTYGSLFADTLFWINDIRGGKSGKVWIVAGSEGKTYTGIMMPQPNGAYKWYGTPFLRFNDLGRGYFSYPEKDGVVWFGGAEGLVRYAPGIPKDYHIEYATIVRSVSVITSDSIIYGGAAFAGIPSPAIDFGNNSLRFEFAAMSFDDPSANRYQVKLEGFDNTWSNWSGETRKDYTGLPPGKYILRVRSKNIYDHPGIEGVFSFSILHPWYQSWWARIAYLFAAFGFVLGIIKYRVRHLEKKTLELESVIAERTKVIRNQTRELRELDTMKSRFYTNISHEFRTPLTLILGPLEQRLAAAKRETEKEELGMMYRNARRLLRLINNLLDLSRLESGKLKLTAERGDLLAFLKGIVMSFASLAEQKNIDLKFESGRDVEACQVSMGVYFDKEKIETIIMNLLSNAFKFTPPGGEITCTIKLSVCGVRDMPAGQDAPFKPDCTCIEICISDTGIGIPADRLPFVFDRFYQVDSTSTREHEGTGIGLALTRELVALHRGSIEIESEEARGTTVTVRLPAGSEHLQPDEIAAGIVHRTPDPGSTAEPEIRPSKMRPGATGSKSQIVSEDIVLIVDDHPDVRNYLRKHLEKNYRIVEAFDGQHGLETAIDVIPDLVISDVMMPKMDGNQLCRALKTNEKTSHIPVILLTAKAADEDKISGLETGADDYLTKPFSARQLRARVKNLIEQRRSLRLRFIREGIMQPRGVAAASMDEAFMHRIMSIIENNLSDETFGVDDLSERIHIGVRQLHRKVRGVTGKSPAELIRTVRLHRARYLLEQKAGTVTEIAFQVGFSNLSHFAKMFRAEFGKRPSEIAKKDN